MKPYSSRSGKKSGVIAFDIGSDFITVQFHNFETYTYSHHSAGASVIEKMKSLARAQQGLSTFIAKYNPAFEKY